MDLDRPFSNAPGARLDEEDVGDPRAPSMWIVEEDPHPVYGRDGNWRAMDQYPSVYISGTSIPKAVDAKHEDVMQRFLFGQSAWVASPTRHGMTGDLPGATAGLMHGPATVHDVGTLASPTASGTDENSQHEMASSYGGTWSDRGSDAALGALPYDGMGLRRLERQTPWSQEPFYGLATPAFSGHGVSGARDNGTGYVNMQEVQVPGAVEHRPGGEQDGSYPASLPGAADAGQGSVGVVAANDEDEELPPDPPTPEAVSMRTRRARRAAPKQHTPSPAPRGRRDHTRPMKSGKVPKLRSPRRCAEHPEAQFKNATDWKRHLNTHHAAPFRCIFSDDYACPQTFGSKNEWKRHINCLHLRLHFWRCHFGPCGASGPQQQQQQQPSRPDGRPKDFNRKDLFTQHLRRMHCSDEIKNDQDRLAAWSKELPDKQKACYIDNRAAPNWGLCGFCSKPFEGEGSWDDCLEHIGKHFEQLEYLSQPLRVDERLQDWMAQEGLLKWNGRSGWELTFEGKQRRPRPKADDESDQDAEAEDDEGQMMYAQG